MYQARFSKRRFDETSSVRPGTIFSTMRESFLGRLQTSTILWGLLVLLAPTGPAFADDKKTIGWIERVSITNEGLTMEAKVDTGADFSSVHAEKIRHFTRDGARWIEFTLRDRDKSAYTLQKPLHRTARIKKKTQGSQTRPVVILQICVGDAQYPAQVNLAQRGHFKYTLLLGRDFLKSRFLVDPGERHLTKPNCQ